MDFDLFRNRVKLNDPYARDNMYIYILRRAYVRIHGPIDELTVAYLEKLQS